MPAYPWQKQEVFKGVNAAGSLSAGWGFHCWTTNINNQSVKVRYSAAGANAMVADGSIVTNAVFDRGVSAMFNSTISDNDRADIPKHSVTYYEAIMPEVQKAQRKWAKAKIPHTRGGDCTAACRLLQSFKQPQQQTKEETKNGT